MIARSVAQAWVGLGSNLGDSRETLQSAFAGLNTLAHTKLVGRSHLWRTPPWGRTDQPAFLNAVALLRTRLTPRELLQALLELEQGAGRVRTEDRWGPRTLDLDLLHMDGVRMDEPELVLPHPRIAERAFVLLPLQEVSPTLCLPGFGPVQALLASVDSAGCEMLA